MSFSIVMLTYNNYEKFDRCMKSMFPLFMREDLHEVIILDNGSIKKELISYLVSVSQAFKKVQVIFSPINLGVAGGRKKLFNIAKGEYIISVDSDVVFVDGNFMFETVKKVLSEEKNKNFLIGGGGGDHVHFPSIYISDVVNRLNSGKKNELLFVDEVAGWCQCFHRSLLEKVEMDDRFHPFWGEDSDFCIQVKRAGGRCAIFGRGIIEHSWSSCRKEENQADLLLKWEMVLEKWSNTRKGFIFDKEYYSMLYGVSNPIQDYFSKQIFNGRIYDKSISTLFCDGEESIEKMERLLTIDKLGKYYYNIIESNIGRGDIYIIDTKHKYIPGDIPLSANVIFIHSPSYLYDTVDSKKYMHVCLKVDIDDPYIILLLLMNIIRKYPTDNVYLHNFEMKEYDKKFNRKGMRRLIREWDAQTKTLVQFEYEKLLKTYLSYPIQKILKSALMIPFEYPNIASPEYSPKHILPELFCNVYTKREGEREKILTIVIGGYNKYLRGDILYIDTGYTISEVPIGVKWYYRIEDYTLQKLIRFITTEFIQIYDYDIIAVVDITNYKIVSDINEFYNRSLYQNQCFILKELSIFSFSITDLDQISNIVKFFNQIEGKKINDNKINIDKSIEQNILDKIFFAEIWNKNVDRETTTYYRDDDSFDKPIDFPLIQKEHYQ